MNQAGSQGAEPEVKSKHPAGKDPYRFVIIGLYLVHLIISGMANNVLTPIATTCMNIYGIKGNEVAMTTSVSQIASIIFSFPSIQLANKYGVKFNAITGTFLIAAGFVVRIFINKNFYLVVLGQFISGAGGPFVSSVQAKVITDWFDKTDRGIWMALSSLAAPIGAMLGFVIPLFFVDGSSKISNDDQKTNITKYLACEAVIGLTTFVLTVLLWRKSRVVSAEEGSADDIRNRETFVINDPEEGLITNTLSQVSRCLVKASVRSMFVLYGVGFGLVTTIGALITAILGCFSYPEYYGPLISVIVIISGLLGSLVYSVKFIRDRHQGKNMFLIVGLSAIFCLLLSIALIYKRGLLTIVILGSLFGMSALNINVLVFEEIIRRIHQQLLITASIVNAMSGQLVSAILIYTIGFFIEPGNEFNGSMIVTSMAVGFSLLFFYCFIAEKRLDRDDVNKKDLKKRLIKESEDKAKSSLTEQPSAISGF